MSITKKLVVTTASALTLVGVTATSAHAADYQGTSGSDHFEGGAEDDWMYGYGSGDKLGGNDGADNLFGHIGNDTLWGDAGPDNLYGGGGRDNLQPGYGNDWVLGARGADDIYIFADGEADVIKCGRGEDTVRYVDYDDSDTFYGCENWEAN